MDVRHSQLGADRSRAPARSASAVAFARLVAFSWLALRCQAVEVVAGAPGCSSVAASVTLLTAAVNHSSTNTQCPTLGIVMVPWQGVFLPATRLACQLRGAPIAALTWAFVQG